MGTIIDYLEEYGDCSFKDMPMNDVDSLVLCQFSYLKFDKMVPDVRTRGRFVPLEEVARHADFEKLFADTRFEKENRALFTAMMAGQRYRTLKLGNYINVIEKEWETQFSAVTFLLENKDIYVAFRGTDETIVGWKEDFNMAFLSPVPCQAYSVKYLNMVANEIHAPLILGGHSKGGNLAVYSAMNCRPHVKELIRKIYSMDGPGFRPETLKSGCYEAVAGRVVKILPHSSLVGMIFERDMRYEVVESTTFGLAQHDPYTWLVEGRHFVKVNDIYESRKFINSAVNEWILSLNETQLRTFVDTLYQVVLASQAEDLIEFTADWKKSMNAALSAFREVDEETAKMLKEVVKALFETATLHMKEEVRANGLLKGKAGKGNLKHRRSQSKKKAGKGFSLRKQEKNQGKSAPDAIEAPIEEGFRE
ncbi:MAG: DUF2974 domain-containing protein [Lachnoclostridium sp.]|nr:DUF2974 domain-containing protein [Lachnospira sp.]MCM1247599.1 DUF2974 domain-containing protein [Lachnoclostridium sp.]MCM1534849.1 DUF2974 domain-containing protein [Clostridium sp.]